MHGAVRGLLLVLSGCGMLVSIFWDEFLGLMGQAHLQMAAAATKDGGGGGGGCPMMMGGQGAEAGAGGGKDGPAVDLAKMLGLEGQVGLEEQVEVEEMLRRMEEGEMETITPEELAFYDGKFLPKRPALVAVGGFVFDVSENDYESYSKLAGKEISRALILSSFDPKDMNNDVSGFSQEQINTKGKWILFFRKKYPLLAKLASGDIDVDIDINVGDIENNVHCKDKVFEPQELEEPNGKVIHAVPKNTNYVLDVSKASWLYNSMGVRYQLAPEGKSIMLYPCLGFLKQKK